MIKGCPGALFVKEARPDYIDCPHCGEEHAITVGDTFVSATIIDHHRPSLSLVSSR